MRVFIAGNYNQPHVYAAYRQELVQLGANVNSAWLEMPPFSKIERRAAAERATGLRLEHLNVPADSAHVWPLVEAHEYLQTLNDRYRSFGLNHCVWQPMGGGVGLGKRESRYRR
jgi:hypothetical protein